jgi:hypothetical protein
MVVAENVAETILTEFVPKFPNLRNINTHHRFRTFEANNNNNNNTMINTDETVVTSTSDHELTGNDSQDRIVTLSTFNGTYGDDGGDIWLAPADSCFFLNTSRRCTIARSSKELNEKLFTSS